MLKKSRGKMIYRKYVLWQDNDAYGNGLWEDYNDAYGNGFWDDDDDAYGTGTGLWKDDDNKPGPTFASSDHIISDCE